MTTLPAAAPYAPTSLGQRASAPMRAATDPVSNGARPDSAADPASPTPASTGFAGGDFQTFLKMLTTQIKHQDPLNPMEGSDFAVQLATFSGVEQQVRTNQLLEQLATDRMGGLGTLAGWIGKEIRTTAPVGFTGGPVALDMAPAPDATAAQLVVLDAGGREISRETVTLTAGERNWLGLGPDGRPLPAGRYSFKLISLKGDDVLKTQAVGAYARVTGAEVTAEGIRLTLPGGASALESEVSALRDPAMP